MVDADGNDIVAETAMLGEGAPDITPDKCAVCMRVIVDAPTLLSGWPPACRECRDRLYRTLFELARGLRASRGSG